jgi:2-haloalkanoic acid dehalogenase type II
VALTFDLFSALIDSRTGGMAFFADLAARRRWKKAEALVYDTWDRNNKASQRDLAKWVSFAEHSRRALAATYRELGLAGDQDDDTAALLSSVTGWPLWPDVTEGFSQLRARGVRPGVLSNVDDDILASTAAYPLVCDGIVLTSARLRAYKPSPALYLRARAAAGGRLLHVAASSRDVRGALEAGIETIRLRRPGHELDRDGPRPAREAGNMAELNMLLRTRYPDTW